jgi:DNA (cytosine-5)-methyltransferase 1
MTNLLKQRFTFVDLFAGCGGLSLGLASSGMQGLFAVEKSRDAFATFKQNFLDGPENIRFDWPRWLDSTAMDIDRLLTEHLTQLRSMRGQVDVVAGGPPCQGFSFAGRRKKSDPRNRLFERYVELVQLLQPKMLLLENVPGMRVVHGTSSQRLGSSKVKTDQSFYAKLVTRLDEAGYQAEGRLLDASNFGVPQRRARLVVLGVRRDILAKFPDSVDSVFKLVEEARFLQLGELSLSEGLSAADAISDLRTKGQTLLAYEGESSRSGFLCAPYSGPRTAYQKLMHEGHGRLEMNSMRLAKHSDRVTARFIRILNEVRKGVNISDADRKKLGLLKHRTVPMAPNLPAPTLTTLPDDLLHYSEPRILTVRESARLQSFPDWFVFSGKYTTGGARRRFECPRYTQVGNAVPPLLARAIGLGLQKALSGNFSLHEARPILKATA